MGGSIRNWLKVGRSIRDWLRVEGSIRDWLRVERSIRITATQLLILQRFPNMWGLQPPRGLAFQVHSRE